ncbi:DUF3575 domain-containing protein [Halosquirtibacter xylanolyticus]|uniref:DUF3575 domain-containing protein n=1 Tax=Halosquirtibacter xylanolyticus TaxID=3374599 RepID=UPI003748EE00|nr:DUF3575 domain-containing protein [Prolixibacteraceae bacterium]
MKKIILLLAITMASLNTKAQGTGTEDLFKINLTLKPGFGVEKKIGDKSTMDLSLKTYWSIEDTEAYIRPSIYLGYRYYYNILMRESKGKDTKGNSASFVTAEIGYIHKNITSNKYWNDINPYGIDCNIMWGIRRTFNWFYLEGQIGVGKTWWHDKQYEHAGTKAIDWRGDIIIGFLL